MLLRAACLALLLGLAIGPVAQAQDVKSAEAFIRTLYGNYKAKGHGVPLTGPKSASVVDPSLAELVKTDQKMLHGEVGALEADPICSCQDFDIRSVDVSVTPDGADKAKATAKFHNLDSDNKIDFDLVAVGGSWRIYDIHDADMPSLRKMLEEEIAEMKAEKAKGKH
jgi:hypothetical protein